MGWFEKHIQSACSNKHEVTKEVAHLKDAFTNFKGYPKSLVERILKKVEVEKNEPVFDATQEIAETLEKETPSRKNSGGLIRRLKTSLKHSHSCHEDIKALLSRRKKKSKQHLPYSYKFSRG